jgi:hypothetical protein
MLIGLLSSILTPIIWLFFIGAGFAWIFSPTSGERLLKHALVSACVYLICISLLQQLVARLSFVAWIGVSLVAYAIWSRRNAPARTKGASHRGSERTPVVPSQEHGGHEQ